VIKKNELRILLIAIVFPLYLLLLSLISRPLLAQLFFQTETEKGMLSAVYYDNDNAAYHYLLGRFYQYRNEGSDLIKAVRQYKESLRRSPLQGGCWLDLAKASQTAGMTAEAGNALRRATRLIPNNPSIMWEAAVFHLIHGDIEESIRNFREFILLRPERQEEVYDIVWKLPVDVQYVRSNLIPDSYPYYKRYLFYLISTDRTEESEDLWREMKRFAVGREVTMRYIDFLITKHLYEDAENVWKDFIQRRFKREEIADSSLIWNGSFENEMLNGGFDWKIAGTEGVDVFLDGDTHMLGEKSLGVTFDGTQNPDITIATQIVRVVPGKKYLLTGNIKTDKLTTTNGIFFSVEGDDCKDLYERSDVIMGTNFWRDISVEFEAPPECSAISVKIRRERSSKFDNKISGTAWIDGINLVQR
jgi:tetratricopeptide (TPR) repeat protein